VILPVRTVGVMGDGRTYDYVVALRAVTSTDGMTADFYLFDMGFVGHVATRVINEVKGVNRVVYDVTSKARPGRSSGSEGGWTAKGGDSSILADDLKAKFLRPER
jgi:hypothetical protein